MSFDARLGKRTMPHIDVHVLHRLARCKVDDLVFHVQWNARLTVRNVAADVLAFNP